MILRMEAFRANDAVNANDVLQLTVDRNRVQYNGVSLPGAVGQRMIFDLQPLGGGQAELTAEFSLTANEVEPVLNVLRSGGLLVTAEHNHFLLDNPRLFLIQAWGMGNDITLAKVIRSALNHTAMKQCTSCPREKPEQDSRAYRA